LGVGWRGGVGGGGGGHGKVQDVTGGRANSAGVKAKKPRWCE